MVAHCLGSRQLRGAIRNVLLDVAGKGAERLIGKRPEKLRIAVREVAVPVEHLVADGRAGGSAVPEHASDAKQAKKSVGAVGTEKTTGQVRTRRRVCRA